MESLLRWGIENSVNSAGEHRQPEPRKDLDPAIIDHILGKPDAELMKEALAIAMDEKRDEDERIQALDDFEMLVEHIDNANNLKKLNMWEPLQRLLTSPTSSEEISLQILWIIGTAMQNNPSAQNAYLSLSPLSTVLSFLRPSIKSSKTRSKAVYTLSGLLQHNATAVRQLEDADGWQVLKAALEDSDISVRRKVTFLLNSLLVPNTPVLPPTPPTASVANNASTSTSTTLHPIAEPPASAPVHPNSHASMLSDPSSVDTSPVTLHALRQHGILQALVHALVAPTPYGPDGESDGDPDFEEKIIRILHTYSTACHGSFETQQKDALRSFLQVQGKAAGGDSQLAENWGLTLDELNALKRATD